LKVLLKVNEDIYPVDGNERIVKGFKKRIGDEAQVSVEQVDEIPRDASGKYR
jgi:phenylacetate-CoA ligase